MGCVCCIPASLNVDAETYTGASGLPDGIIHVTENSSETIKDQFSKLIGTSFCGSTENPPEAVLSWCHDPTSCGDNSAGVLISEPTEARIQYFQGIAKWSVLCGLRHGGCFALIDVNNNNKLVAATISYPPNDKQLHKQGMCEEIYLMNRMGGAKAIPSELKEGPCLGRLKVVGKQMSILHAKHSPGRHLYVHCFATAADEQGKGYGRKLMTFLTNASNEMQVNAYLECSGTRNERFYTNNGYVLQERSAVIYKDSPEFRPDDLDGISAMTYQYKEQSKEKEEKEEKKKQAMELNGS